MTAPQTPVGRALGGAAPTGGPTIADAWTLWGGITNAPGHPPADTFTSLTLDVFEHQQPCATTWILDAHQWADWAQWLGLDVHNREFAADVHLWEATGVVHGLRINLLHTQTGDHR